MPISRAELAARLIHRKFWSLGLFLSLWGTGLFRPSVA
jgi:hypothetical protein